MSTTRVPKPLSGEDLVKRLIARAGWTYRHIKGDHATIVYKNGISKSTRLGMHHTEKMINNVVEEFAHIMKIPKQELVELLWGKKNSVVASATPSAQTSSSESFIGRYDEDWKKGKEKESKENDINQL
ncbi:hypothetical protein QOT17_019802 [Balamuthia mandrillaris]